MSGIDTDGSGTSTPYSVDQISEYIRTQDDVMSKMESYDDAECRKIMCNIGIFFKCCVPHRLDIVDLMAKLKYPELLVKLLKNYDFIGSLDYTDVSQMFCQGLITHGVMDIICSNIRQFDDENDSDDENHSDEQVTEVLENFMTILHNLTRHAKDLPAYQEAIEKYQIKEILHSHFLTSDNDDLRCLSMMIFTNIISEEENKLLDGTGAISFMVTKLTEAIENEGRHSSDGYHPRELVECLGRMAHNDNNKFEIVKHGALRALVDMMRHPSPEENAAATYTIWILSFDKKIRAKIKAEHGLLDALEKLKTSPDQNTSKSAKGALWTINEEQHKVTAPAASGAKGNHVFISYNWGNQDMIKQLNDALKKAGYNTWLDIEQMAGSTLEAMAEAVEGAAIILICGSEKYKQSPNCRAEAEYTFQLKKEIVPLMLQKKYKPDGWLGMLFGAKLYINFDEEDQFDDSFQKLLKELSSRGQDGVDQPDGAGLIQASTVSVVTAAPTQAKPYFTKWSEKQVEKFFDDADLESVKSRFKGYNGEMLSGLRSLKQDAPGLFYKRLDTEWKISMDDIIKLTAALDKL